ncbi:hypothetical protein Cus16_2217 [Curtobacterium sp. ER1/6]|nr:hypothetical protein Cus16_2217 [Curtobacterium sp. ER1/6]
MPRYRVIGEARWHGEFDQARDRHPRHLRRHRRGDRRRARRDVARPVSRWPRGRRAMIEP